MSKIYIKITNTGWYCDDCGFIDSYEATINFKNKNLTAFYDGHFGYGDLHYEFESDQNLMFIFSHFKNEFMEMGLSDIKNIDFTDDGSQYFYNVTIIFNDSEETLSIPEQSIFKELFSHIGLDSTFEYIDESKQQSTYQYEDFYDNEA